MTNSSNRLYKFTNIYFVYLLYAILLSINDTTLRLMTLSLLALKVNCHHKTNYIDNICKNKQFSKKELVVILSSIVLIFLSTHQIPSKIPEPLVFIVLPVIEELVFRKYMITLFNSTFGVILSSILFAMLHSQSLILFLSSMSMGIILGIIYLRTEKVENTIIIHYIFNFCTLVTKLI